MRGHAPLGAILGLTWRLEANAVPLAQRRRCMWRGHPWRLPPPI